jgi:hypothetical protein
MMRVPLRHWRILPLLAAGALASATSTTASAQPAVYKDREGSGASIESLRRLREPTIEERMCCASAHMPQRLVTGGPGYVGSVRGLGRPSYDGLWPPPGYGSYRELPTD